MEKEIKIADFFSVIKRRLWIIGFITIFTTAASAAYGMYTTSSWTPSYQASTKILLTVNRADLLNTMGVIIKDAVVLDRVVEELQLETSSADLAGKVSFRSENESQIVRITVNDSNQELAATIANATASSFIREIGVILGIYDAKVLSEAKAEPNPVPINSKPRPKIELGFAVGLVLSIGVILLLDSLDHTIRSEQEAEKLLGLPILGTVSRMNRRNTKEASKRKEKSQKSSIQGGGISVQENS